MKINIIKAMLLISLFGLMGCRSTPDPSAWNNKKINNWFGREEWLSGWEVTPDSSINKRELAVSYFLNKDRWDKAFKFLKDSDLSKLELKRYDIDGDYLFATVSEYLTKNEETTNFEAHRKYIDIQYVIMGKEIMNIAPLSTVKDIVISYDDSKDIEFVTVDKVVNHLATPGRLFIFFPDDAHRPGLKDEVSSQVRKIVIKLKIE
jgi:YhcH/YjgK/YiaL family protein